MSNSSMVPSAMDLLLVFPRLAQRAGAFAFSDVPGAMGNIAGKLLQGGSMIADATASASTSNSTITNTSRAFAQHTASTMGAAFGEAMLGSDGGEGSSSSLVISIAHAVGKLKSFGGIFGYLTSKWALTTFTVAILLNRTQFYASSREHLRLRWHMRVALYAIPILVFLGQTLSILQALRCQTSPDYPLIRYGDANKNLAIDFGADGGFLYGLSSSLLFWQNDTECCTAQHMSLSAAGEDKAALRGSLSLLYYFFITICTGQLFETLICALQGKQPMPETGMTIFEHSLAFAECEAMLSSALGFGFFGLPRADKAGHGSGAEDGLSALITRAEILPRLNVPPEVLLVCLISCFSHLSSALLAVTKLRHRVRLVNTAIWACCYMTAFIWSFHKTFFGPLDSITDLGVLRFPTVCIVGFIPHLLILSGIIVCGAIYGLALLVTALSIPPEAGQGLTLKERIAWAYNNLQANVQFSQNSAIRIRMSEDFYTTLLKVGFNVLTAASEAVYLNEGSKVQVAQMTWLERKRIEELAAPLEQRQRPQIPAELLGQGIAHGVGFVDHQNAAISQSPYARERKSRPAQSKDGKPVALEMDTGLGLTQRRSRMQLTFDFVAGIFWLVVSLQGRLALELLRRLGLESRPPWLLKAAGITADRHKPSLTGAPFTAQSELDFYVVGPDGSLSLPPDAEIDVEAEMRKRQQQAGTFDGEESFGDQIYGWWQQGGWFGNIDTSGEYRAREIEDDETSMISMSTTTDAWEDEEDEENSGQRTPTRENPGGYGTRQSSATPEPSLDPATLSRLLDPRTAADREEARLLSYTLRSERPITRSQYRRNVDRDRSEVLSGLRSYGAATRPAVMTEEEEEHDLESFLLAQRAAARVKVQKGNGATWESGAEGMGAGGPQCVVCQSTPRTVLVWPCGCLSMCDDCRLGLAARNYTKCICCRTDIAAYSRLYVP